MRKKKEEEEAFWIEYLEQRKKARQKEEEDLRKLKERQVHLFVVKIDAFNKRNLIY